MKHCNQKSEFPVAPHLAIIHFGSIFIPGDERSKSAPGHGYPDHYESVVTYIAFNDTTEGREELRRWVENHQKDNYQIISVIPKNVKTKLVVELS